MIPLMIFRSTLIEKHIARYLRAHSKCSASANRGIWFKWNLETFNFNCTANRKLFLLSASRRTQILSLRIFPPTNFTFASTEVAFLRQPGNAIWRNQIAARLIVVLTMIFDVNNSLNSIMIFICFCWSNWRRRDLLSENNWHNSLLFICEEEKRNYKK